MSYSLTVEPTTVEHGQTALATATVPEVPAEVITGELVHRGTAEVRATQQLTVQYPQPTIGTVTDEASDYYVTFGDLTVVQTGDNTFEVQT